MDKIVPAFEISLMDPTLANACVDFVETGIDSVLNDGVLKSIPIVGVLVGIGKTAQNIHDRNLLRQTLRFINSFNSGTIKREKLEKYRSELNSDQNKAEAELGRVLILLNNNNIDLKKSDILGKLYKAYVYEDITWEDFCELSDVVNRLFLTDLELLIQIECGEVKKTKDCVPYKAERLNSLGLIDMVIQAMIFSSDPKGNDTDKAIEISELGKRLVDYGVKYERW